MKERQIPKEEKRLQKETSWDGRTTTTTKIKQRVGAESKGSVMNEKKR